MPRTPRTIERIDIVADYGHVGDLAFAEVEQKLIEVLPPTVTRIRAHSVQPFDTVSTGFYLAQLALNSKLGSRQLFYVNTAPRKDDIAARVDSAGEGLVYAKLYNDIEVIAVNSGHSLSFIKSSAREICKLDIPSTGSQFRSRDVFPAAVAEIVNGNMDILLDDITDTIPDLPEDHIGYIDGYGNIKTTLPNQLIENLMGKTVRLSMNNSTHKASIAPGIFAVKDGDLVFAPGSTGWDFEDGSSLRFIEIVLRGGSAAGLFGNPPAGAKIHWQLADD